MSKSMILEVSVLAEFRPISFRFTSSCLISSSFNRIFTPGMSITGINENEKEVNWLPVKMPLTEGGRKAPVISKSDRSWIWLAISQIAIGADKFTNDIIAETDTPAPAKPCDIILAVWAVVLSSDATQVPSSEIEYPNWHSFHFSVLWSPNLIETMT